jgi:hypothetical protein
MCRSRRESVTGPCPGTLRSLRRVEVRPWKAAGLAVEGSGQIKIEKCPVLHENRKPPTSIHALATVGSSEDRGGDTTER